MTGCRDALQVALLVLAATCSVSRASAQEPFYKGKRLTVLVNFAPGGSTDIEGRLFARHIAKHIDGQPNVVVQNMDGAGGLNGTAYLGEVAPKDGTMLGFLGGAAWQYASEPERFRVDFAHLRVHRLSARHHGLLRALRRGARHEAGGRHRQGAGTDRRRQRRPTTRATCSSA